MVGNLRPRTPKPPDPTTKTPKGWNFSEKIGGRNPQAALGVRRPPLVPPLPGCLSVSQLSQLGHTEAQILLSSAWVASREPLKRLLLRGLTPSGNLHLKRKRSHYQ